MSKRKNSSPHYSPLNRILQNLIPGKQGSPRRRKLNSTAYRRRVRIAFFSTWGSDYQQLELSVPSLLGMIVSIVAVIITLTVLATYGINRLVQNYRLSALEKDHQILRSRLNQTGARVRDLLRHVNNSDEQGPGFTHEQDHSNLPAFRTLPEDGNGEGKSLPEPFGTIRDVLASQKSGGRSDAEGNKSRSLAEPNSFLGKRGQDSNFASVNAPERAAIKDDNDSSIFVFGQGGGAYVDEEDDIYPTFQAKQRFAARADAIKDERPQKSNAESALGDLISEVELRVSESQELQKTITEEFEARRKQLEHIPTIKPLLSGRITDLFGKRRDPFIARTRHHQGLDIGAPRGTEVYAPANGVVEFVKTTYRRNRGYGKAVVINHGHGIKTLYGHLFKINVKAGQKIERWDLIGLVGDTGRATGPHLHYEVWVDGEARDPMLFILNN
jgi:murein DD-endopeptidase MepM/ murein hydrolase activator NlpD